MRSILTTLSPSHARNAPPRWEEDVKLLKQLGVTHYRFSVAWPRIIPGGMGPVNQPGLDYYSRLVDALLKNGIQPAVTLYHWDLPQPLQDKGGWTSAETVDAFAAYADVVFGALGDRVKMWFTLNEPWSTAVLGHGLGTHAPGIKDQSVAVYQAAHNQLLAHAAAVKVRRYNKRPTGRDSTPAIHVLTPSLSLSRMTLSPPSGLQEEVQGQAEGQGGHRAVDAVQGAGL